MSEQPDREGKGARPGWRRALGISGALLLGVVGLIWALDLSRGDGLVVGDQMPDFSLSSGEGQRVTRADLLGKGPIVLYFYPKDDTPGCTAQACAFRDAYEDFTDAGAVVVGVSSDSAEDHRAFALEYGLPFVILADPDEALREAFGVPKSLGLLPGRVTYVMDRAGVIRHRFVSQLEVLKHVSEALETVQRLKAAP